MNTHSHSSQESIGSSEAFLRFQEQLSAVAPINRPVLIIGERGTGKELAAKRLHFLSTRWQGPLVTLNCAALAPNLLESELFGHEAGSFTGASSKRIGRFEAADGGTVFLDEIGNMPLVVQEKILRVIEYGTFERVGGSKQVSVQVRVIAATHNDLQKKAAEGFFMKDLLDRLCFEVLQVPPLRERHEDIVKLAMHFATKMSLELERSAPVYFSEQALGQLNAYQWPGNIRECKNVVERALYRARDNRITTITFNPFATPYKKSPQQASNKFAGDEEGETAPKDLNLQKAIEALKIRYLSAALTAAVGNQGNAAKILGLTYDQFRGLYRRYKSKLNLW